jgi:hypothetical protein
MQVFVIAPPDSRPLWIMLPVAVLVLAGVVVLATSLYGARSSRFEVTPAGLQIRGDWYGRFIPADTLVRDRAQRVTLTAAADLRPTRRTMGTGLPGYQAGWFRLANGEKALLYLTDRTKAVYVPTTSGFSLLLSPQDPDGFLSALRSQR